MEIITTPTLKELPLTIDSAGFTSVFTDHMFIAHYRDGKWDEGKIIPFQALSLHPAATCLQYAQEVFEGLKAYRGVDGLLRLFRYQDNISRLEASCERLCMPKMDRSLFESGLLKLLALDGRWAYPSENLSLYIRPYMLGIDSKLGVHPASEYLFVIIMTPVGAYYAAERTKIKIEDHYQRVATYGTGTAKAGGNYAASFLASYQAKADGFDQVLWLDAKEGKYIEEVGAMNICFVIDGKLVTPRLNSSILDGITRRSIITLAKEMHMVVEERLITVDELFEAYNHGSLTEMFGCGTAAVVAKISKMCYRDQVIELDDVHSIADALKQQIKDIQYGKVKDKYDWITVVEE
jgi:branched-chain amino acid aminotransferase